MSTDRVSGRLNDARNSAIESEPRASALEGEVGGEALEFVRFCYRRRRVSWPALYDEMCAVAARGMYRGLSYAELAEHGINFCLGDLPRLAALTELVIAEERGRMDARRGEHPAAVSLSAAPATG